MCEPLLSGWGSLQLTGILTGADAVGFHAILLSPPLIPAIVAAAPCLAACKLPSSFLAPSYSKGQGWPAGVARKCRGLRAPRGSPQLAVPLSMPQLHPQSPL